MKSWLSVEEVSPKMAAEWLQNNNSNRHCRMEHVAHLAREMRAGSFVETAEVHIFSVDGEQVLCNGQHTLKAITEYGFPVRVTVRRSVGTQVECNIVRAVGHDKGLQRSQRDTFAFYDIGHTVGFSAWYISKIASAIRWAKGGFGAVSRSINRISDIYIVNTVPLWGDEFSALQDSIVKCEKYTRNAIMRQDVLPIALLTFHYQPNKAGEFWRAISSGSNLSDNDPRFKAYRYLMSDKFDVSRRRRENPAVSTRKIALAWNRFFDDEPLSRFPAIDGKSIVKLSGTHYTGKQPQDMWPNKSPVKVA